MFADWDYIRLKALKANNITEFRKLLLRFSNSNFSLNLVLKYLLYNIIWPWFKSKQIKKSVYQVS